MSTDRFNTLPIRQAFVVPLATREHGFPHHVAVADDGGLNQASWAMCEAVRAVSLERFGQFIGTAISVTVAEIINQVMLWLGHCD
jgi:mRNA interferase MazF